MLVTSPSKGAWYGKDPSSKQDSGGYEIRLTHWADALARANNSLRNEWEERTVYVVRPMSSSFPCARTHPSHDLIPLHASRRNAYLLRTAPSPASTTSSPPFSFSLPPQIHLPPPPAPRIAPLPPSKRSPSPHTTSTAPEHPQNPKASPSSPSPPSPPQRASPQTGPGSRAGRRCPRTPLARAQKVPLIVMMIAGTRDRARARAGQARGHTQATLRAALGRGGRRSGLGSARSRR